MRLLMTGGTGYVGSYLVHRLSQDERIEEIYVLSRNYKEFLRSYEPKVEHVSQDVRDAEGLREKLEAIRPDVILHLAALIRGPPAELVATNVVGTINLLEAVKDLPLRLLVFASTAANLYGNAIYRPIDEGHPLKPISPYGLSKQMAEDAVRFYALRHDVPAVIFRQTNIYGWAPIMKRTLINAFIESALRDRVLRIFGTGEQQRNFLHLEDLARYYEAILFCDKPEELKGQVFNVAGPQTATISEVAELLRELLAEKYSLEVEIRYEKAEARKHEIYDFTISYEKARKVLGVEPRIELRRGLGLELARALEHGTRGGRATCGN